MTADHPWAAGVVLSVACVAALGAQEPTSQQEEQLRGNARVLRAALPLLYPTLSTQPVDVFTAWTLGMNKALGAIGVPVRRTEVAPVGLLQIEADITRGYLTWLSAEGSHVHSADLSRLAAELTQNRGSLDDVTRALRAMGAKFGPDRGAALVRGHRRRQLERVFGKIVVMVVRFEWLDTHNTTYSVSAPKWRVVVEATPRSSTSRCVDLVFEPIDGELIHVFTAFDVRGDDVSFTPCRLPAARVQ